MSSGIRSAFPLASQSSPEGKKMSPRQEGMTLREWYIGQALVGLCANPQSDIRDADQIAHRAVDIGDATLRQVDKNY